MDVNFTLQRIRDLMTHYSLNATKFAEKIGVNQSNFSAIMNQKRPLGDGVLNKILLSFDINKDWLLEGKGEMLKPEPRHEASVIEDPNVIYVPLVGQYAHAGYLCGYTDPQFVDTLPKIPVIAEHQLRGDYLNFEVKGDSMDDGSSESLKEGDVLVCRIVRPDLWQYKLHINDWDFVIVHREEGILVKRIVKHDVETGDIVIHSLNPFYKDVKLNLRDVAQLFNVVQVMRSRRR